MFNHEISCFYDCLDLSCFSRVFKWGFIAILFNLYEQNRIFPLIKYLLLSFSFCSLQKIGSYLSSHASFSMPNIEDPNSLLAVDQSHAPSKMTPFLIGLTMEIKSCIPSCTLLKKWPLQRAQGR